MAIFRGRARSPWKKFRFCNSLDIGGSDWVMVSGSHYKSRVVLKVSVMVYGQYPTSEFLLLSDTYCYSVLSTIILSTFILLMLWK